MRCEASMDPAPEISWEIQGKSSDFKDVVSLSEDNSTLTLSQPRVEDSGEYTCTAGNNVGRDSKSSSIEVLSKLFTFCRIFRLVQRADSFILGINRYTVAKMC